MDDAVLTFLDLEMTGLDPQADRICEVAAVRIEGGVETGRVDSLIDPTIPLGRSTEVHGLTDEAVAASPRLGALAEGLGALFAGATVVGHAVHYDLAFLEAAAARGEIGPAPTSFVCTRALARTAWRRPSYGLARLAADLGLPAPTHRAMADVTSTRALFARLLEELAPATVEDLQRAQHREGPATLRGDHEAILRAAFEARRPVAIRYRVPGRDPFDEVLEVWRLAPPRVEGWLRERGVQRVLRGDRLIRVGAVEGRYTPPEAFRSALPPEVR